MVRVVIITLFFLILFEITTGINGKVSAYPFNEVKWVKGMVLHRWSNALTKNDTPVPLPDIDQDNEHFKSLHAYIKEGVTTKGNLFTIYNNKMRDAVISLFRLLDSLKPAERMKVEKWAQKTINSGIYNYAIRIYSLFGKEYNPKNYENIPEFIRHPNYFVTSDVIARAASANMLLLLKEDFKDTNIEYKKGNVIINSNYSNWNKFCEDVEVIEYFSEDVSLNAYYYGISLAHPFWMTEEEIKAVNPRHNEEFYFLHKQLFSRFVLESISKGLCESLVTQAYNPNLINDIAEEFPVRLFLNWKDKEGIRLKTLDIALQELVSRGISLLENSTTANVTVENHIDLLVRMVRTHFDSVKVANRIRKYLGRGSTSPALSNAMPTILHFPETMLRDPQSFLLISYGLEYIFKYLETVEVVSLKQYELEEFKIISLNHTKIETFFETYLFDITRVFTETPTILPNLVPIPVKVKQRRININQFTISLNVYSTVDKNVTVKYFIAPICNKTACCETFNYFFLLDEYRYHVIPGKNLLKWTPEQCMSCSDDEYFNGYNVNAKLNNYNMFKFPKRLLLPRGHENGYDVTLFVIVTEEETYDIPRNNYNEQVYKSRSTRPLDFPFHRPLINCELEGSNYDFFNITIYHRR